MLGGLGLLCALLFGALRPAIAWLLRALCKRRAPGRCIARGAVDRYLASSYVTAYLGVHPVFGAFLFGACLPRDDRLLYSLIERIEHVSVLVLMPVFFALAGLNTTADAFLGAGPANMFLILAVAVGGKIVGGGFRCAYRRRVLATGARGGLLDECPWAHGVDRHEGRA